ncbi:MAG: peptidoglycan DD-metalloendopeptidase family protein, partial [Eubacterium sp.]|nr:peptidoglycan DD-metalloendopeptidase family protein [Eubacterium sp.]
IKPLDNNILTTGVIPQKPPENQGKPEQAKQFTEMPKIKHSQNISSKAVSKAETSKVLSNEEASRTTKGDFRRSASKTAKQAEKAAVFSFAVMPTGKTLIKGTVKAGNTAAENILTESKSAVKNSFAKAIEENTDNSLAITAVDKGIKTADTITTTVKGTKAVVKTGKGAVKTAASAPKNIYSGAVKLKQMSNKLRKMAQIKKIKQLKLVGKGLVHIGKMAATAALKLLSTLLTAVSGYIIPIIIIIIAVFIIVAVVSSLIPAISLKADDEVLTQVWEYVTEKDADFEIEYKNEFNSFPQGVPNYKYMDVKKYFSVNGTQVLKDEREYNNIATMYDAPIFDAGITYSEINKTTFKTNIDALLIYLDAKYEDYEFSEVQTDIDELYNKVLSVQYVSNIDNPSIRNMGDNFAYVYILNLNLHYKELKIYIQENKDVLFTNNEIQTYDVLDEVGQYMTKIELGKPIETDDTSIACQKRYGYYADTDTNEKKFHSGIDITASPGTNVLSPISGKVESIDGDKVEIYSKSSKRIVSISNVTGISVSVGDTVKKGSGLGSVDGSGYICLEYKIKKALSEVSLNPSFYIDNLVYTSNASSSTFYDVAINLDDYIISSELTGTARAVVEAALSMVGSTGYTNSCAKAVSTIYKMAGLGYHGGNGNDFSRANKLSVTDGLVDYTQIPVGSYIGIKYGTGNAGYLYGHVAVYVGLIDGVPSVVQGGSDAITITSLDHYYEYFVTNNPNSIYGNDIGWNITSTNGSVNPLYFEGTGE